MAEGRDGFYRVGTRSASRGTFGPKLNTETQNEGEKNDCDLCAERLGRPWRSAEQGYMSPLGWREMNVPGHSANRRRLSLERRRLDFEELRSDTGDRASAQGARIRARNVWAVVWGLAAMTGTVCLGANGQGISAAAKPARGDGSLTMSTVRLVLMRRKAPEHLQVTS